jgi:hypothetical protein
MATARKAPPGFIWRPSTLPHLRRVMLLERSHDMMIIGSVGPASGGKWVDRDTGESFATRGEAMSNVEKYIK